MHLKKLDAIRGFAAIYVVIYHMIPGLWFVPKIIKNVFFSFGQEAVMLFFLLSGFVIYVSIHGKTNLNFRSYFIKRFRRIYLPFFVSLILCILIAIISGHFNNKFEWQSLLANILMLQDIKEGKPGVWFAPFLGNLPLWSLAYEWWFYLLFYPVYKFIGKNPQRIYFVLGFSVLSYLIYIFFPNQIALYFSYFIVWWCGLESAAVYMSTGRFTLRTMKPILICLFFMVLLSAIPVALTDKVVFGYYPFLMLRHFFIVFFALIVGLVWYQRKLIYFNNILGVFTKIAPISYGIYIFHFPILARWNFPSGFNLFSTYFIKILAILLLSYLVEIQLQPIINRWLKA